MMITSVSRARLTDRALLRLVCLPYAGGELAEWRRHTTRHCSIRQFPGGHFFLFRGDNQQLETALIESPPPALRSIVTSLEQLAR